MKIQKIILLCCIIPLLSFTVVHKYYISVTNIDHSSEEKSLQITTQIFIDDFQTVLEIRYGLHEELTVEKATKEVEQMMAKYLQKKLKIWVNGDLKTCTFLGKKYENDVVVCYLEIEGIDDITSLEVENRILYELLEEQQNLVHTKIKNQRQSLLLVKENDKGLLNF